MTAHASRAFDGETYEPELDFDRLTTLLERVYKRMSDGHWHTLAELATHCGGTEASVSARLRDLRKPRFGVHDVRNRLDEAQELADTEYLKGMTP